MASKGVQIENRRFPLVRNRNGDKIFLENLSTLYRFAFHRMINIEDAWYRVSIKAIVRNTEWRILLCKESDGSWDLPWGGLDHGEGPVACITRELFEEMGLVPKSVSPNPIRFVTVEKPASASRPWIANACYVVELEDDVFTRTDECQEIGYYDSLQIRSMNVLPNVVEVFDSLSKECYDGKNGKSQ